MFDELFCKYQDNKLPISYYKSLKDFGVDLSFLDENDYDKYSESYLFCASHLVKLFMEMVKLELKNIEYCILEFEKIEGLGYGVVWKH